jgi:hypothetical protein
LAKIREAREASGCEALDREADALKEQARAIADRIYETQATSFAGIIAQLELVKAEQDNWTLLERSIAGVKRLAGGASDGLRPQAHDLRLPEELNHPRCDCSPSGVGTSALPARCRALRWARPITLPTQ